MTKSICSKKKSVKLINLALRPQVSREHSGAPQQARTCRSQAKVVKARRTTTPTTAQTCQTYQTCQTCQTCQTSQHGYCVAVCLLRELAVPMEPLKVKIPIFGSMYFGNHSVGRAVFREGYGARSPTSDPI